jgi:hypothetical protein
VLGGATDEDVGTATAGASIARTKMSDVRTADTSHTGMATAGNMKASRFCTFMLADITIAGPSNRCSTIISNPTWC